MVPDIICSSTYTYKGISCDEGVGVKLLTVHHTKEFLNSDKFQIGIKMRSILREFQ